MSLKTCHLSVSPLGHKEIVRKNSPDFFVPNGGAYRISWKEIHKPKTER